MQVQVEGLVVREYSIGESDKTITILTSEHGLISALVKGAKYIRNKNASATQLFSYSRFTLYKNRKGYILDDSEVKDIFFGLRNDIVKLTIAQYFCEISLVLSPSDGDTGEFLRLILNSLYYISNEKKSLEIIKSIFEMRMCTISGYMPDIVGCRNCGEYISDIMYFDVPKANLICGRCIDYSKKEYIKLNLGVITALRHIVYSSMEKIFSFSLSGESVCELSSLCEVYILHHVNDQFKTLEFYNSIIR